MLGGGGGGVKGEAHSCRRKPETMLKPLICAATDQGKETSFTVVAVTADS